MDEHPVDHLASVEDGTRQDEVDGLVSAWRRERYKARSWSSEDVTSKSCAVEGERRARRNSESGRCQ